MSLDNVLAVDPSFVEDEDVVAVPEDGDEFITMDEPELLAAEPVLATTTASIKLSTNAANLEDTEMLKTQLPKAARAKAYKPPAVGTLFGRLAKRKMDALAEDVSQKMDDDGPIRRNAIVFQGEAISNLSTKQIFEFCAYYSSTEVSQLEWVDDLNCVLVYADPTLAMAAYKALSKSGETPDPDDLTLHPCHLLPIEMWPIEERVSRAMGASIGPAGPRKQINLRWALKSDVKVTNARHQSKYYEKYGAPTSESDSKKRRRGDEDEDDDAGGSLRRRIDMDSGNGDGAPARRSRKDVEREKADLDAELERFANGETITPIEIEAPPSDSDAATTGESISLSERLGPVRDGRRIAPLPGRRRGVGGGGDRDSDRDRKGSSRRPALDKDALDAELESFLHSK